MSIQKKLNELANRRAMMEQGDGSPSAARKRIGMLLDEASFVELGSFIAPRVSNYNLAPKDAPADGVVAGYGTINNRLVYVYSQDASVLGGALGEMHAKKIGNLYETAVKMGAPIIALLDSAGARLQESTDALEGFGAIFSSQAQASGVVPQIAAVLGTCGGGAAIIPSLSDITLMTASGSSLFVNSANVLEGLGEGTEPLASAAFHGETTGIVDIVCETEADCLAAIRQLVELLPANCQEDAPAIPVQDDLNRTNENILQVLENGLDGRSLIQEVADNRTVVELRSAYASDVVTAMGHLGGHAAGFIANHTVSGDGRLSAAAMEKISDFVKLMDAFSIPIVNFIDTTGFAASVNEEKKGLSKSAARMAAAFANATTTKISVIANRAYGTAYVISNSRHVGADIAYAWPSASILMMEASSAVKIIYAKEIEEGTLPASALAEKTAQYVAEQGDAYAAASRGYIDDIIEPASTRKRLIAAIEMLYSKQVAQPARKHATI